MLHDAFRDVEKEPDSLKSLLEECEKPLYVGSKCPKDVSPLNNRIPNSLYDAKKLLKGVGLQYEKIPACENDCVLFWKEHKEASQCPICGTSRWKKNTKNVPSKVLWYFPPIPRFTRMCSSPKRAQDLTWHTQGWDNNGMLSHPRDSPSWKLVDRTWKEFSEEKRNLRLALSANGLKQAGNNNDVYLAPLIVDLKLLWETGGVLPKVIMRVQYVQRILVHSGCQIRKKWMYPIERYMKTLKGYVRNHHRPKGCIAECYVAGEALEFCSDYLKNMKSIGNPHERVDERIRTSKPLSRGTFEVVDAKLLDEAHLYVVLGTMESDQSLSHDEDSKQRGPTMKGKTTKGKFIITYNKNGVPIGVEAMKLASFDGMVARSMVPITYMNFELDPRSRKNTLQSIGTKWKNFKHYLYKKFIEKFKNDPNANLFNPPEMYHYLKIDEWKMQETGKEEDEIDRALLWKKARQMKKRRRKLPRVGKAYFEDNPPKELLDTSCYIVIDIASNIVAKGTIVKQNDLSGENIEVMMEMSVQGDALLPSPLDEEFIYKVKDAVGFLVKWARHLVIRCSDLEEEKGEGTPKMEKEKEKEEGKGEGTPQRKKEEEKGEGTLKREKKKEKDEGTPQRRRRRAQMRIRLRVERNRVLKVFARMVDIQLKNMESVKVQCEDDMFGYLFEEIKNGPKIHQEICFMSLSAISPSGRKEKFKNSDEAIRSVADQLSLRKDNAIVLVPYNPREMKLYTSQSGSNKRVSLNCIIVLCPRQSGGTECGYYVCKFMKEIVENDFK
ncbi:hypothetical protein F3Y22_tig00111254pilonHSYRG00002 [Hibiscus syriacus]|uniref:DUF4218 domain-containing protein n=1 Tax=Hibiscus syriacus TaxID=106335 RepID=A0A6A2YSH1_HIBSY|nr:hypothetical protein F3Y22_tig00111254pilonHSYRG00002 [Hibiscus syriacus]